MGGGGGGANLQNFFSYQTTLWTSFKDVSLFLESFKA